MSVVSLPGYEPLPRFDGVPWVSAQISEGAVQAGPFTLIDTIPLVPVDADPSEPQSRDFTSVNAMLASGWYPVALLDAAGHSWAFPPRPFPPPAEEPVRPIVSLGDLKDSLGVKKPDRDADLMRIVRGVTVIIERLTAKRFSPTPELASDPAVTVTAAVGMAPVPRSLLWGPASFGTPLGSVRTAQEWPITIPHASEIDALSLDTTGALLAGQYVLETDSTLQDPYTRRVVILDPAALPAQTLTVTGRFGIVPAPDDLVDAALSMCARRYKERDASWGDSVQLPDGGLISYYRSLPPWVRLVIDSYCEVSM